MVSSVYIAKNVYGGDGLGRLGDGRVVFVPGAWAGEQVKAEITAEKRGYVKARLVEVVEPSPDRIEGGEFAAVPGCVYAGLSYAAERRAKAAQLAEFLERMRIDVPVETVETRREGESPFGYRNKVVYHFGRKNGKIVIGYRVEPAHEVVDVESDPLAAREINAKLPEIRKAVMSLLTQGAESVRRDLFSKGNLTVRWSEKTGVKWWVGETPKDLVFREVTCGRTFEVPAGGFYQINPRVGGILVKTVVDELDRDPSEAEKILDLYCGVGVFGLCAVAVKPGRGLTGVESGRRAVEFAGRNAAAMGVKAEFFAGETARMLRRLKCDGKTTVIVDPPRGGMERATVEFLVRSGAPKICYVSCDPATLQRDLKVLCSAYRVKSVKWFDMFPRTARFETLVVLTRI